MFNCSTHIVECLRNNKIYPKAHSQAGNPQYGIEYTDKSRFEATDVYWYVDLKKMINITSYQIRSDAYCLWIKKWDILLSNDTVSWSSSVSSHSGFSYNKIYNISKPQVARYFKIEGSTPGCKVSKYLAFYWVKIFGSIVIGRDKTCKCMRRSSINFLAIIIPLLTIK